MTKNLKSSNTITDVIERIDSRLAARKAAGLKSSDRAISLLATNSPDTIRSIRRGAKDGSQTGVSTETLKKLASALGTSLEWLLTGNGVEDIDDIPHDVHIDSSHILIDPPPSQRMVKLKGYVGAGSEAHYYNLADDEFEEVPAMEGAGDQSIAVEIRGKSWGPLMDGWLVHYDDVRSPVTDDMLNKICVVGLADDRILLKKIRRERDGSYSLLSNANDEPPIRDVIIEWAALVTGFKPR